MSLEWLVQLAIDPRTGAIAILVAAWWFERQDKIYERTQRVREREQYDEWIKEGSEKLENMVDRAHQNLLANTMTLKDIRDAFLNYVSGGGSRAQ